LKTNGYAFFGASFYTVNAQNLQEYKRICKGQVSITKGVFARDLLAGPRFSLLFPFMHFGTLED